MKRKLSSFIIAIFVLLVSVFASACTDKYKKLEFKVYYAFSADAEVWVDGTDGISLNYSIKKDNEDLNNSDDAAINTVAEEENENPSFVFGANGGTLYVKVSVEGVDAKYVDKIILSVTSTENLSFGTKEVEEDEVVPIAMTDNVDTTLKIFETNSRKKHGVGLSVSRELESIVADENLKPAIPYSAYNDNELFYGWLSLIGLENLTYYPYEKTNQLGVEYSIESIGYYLSNGEYEASVEDENVINEFIKINDGVLEIIETVKEGETSLFNNENYVIRVRATSTYNESIYADFDVYIVDSLIKIQKPNTKFKDTTTEPETILLYENASGYTKSTITVSTDPEKNNNKLVSGVDSSALYNKGVYTKNGLAKYSVALEVQDTDGAWKKCNFENQENEEGKVGINGLYVERKFNQDETVDFTFSIASRAVEVNKVRLIYELEGFDYYYPLVIDEYKEIEIKKLVIPTGIVVDDTTILTDGATVSANVLSTSNSNYKGLKLKFSAYPIETANQVIKFAYNREDIKVKNEAGEEVSSINSGESVYVKFINSTISSTELTVSIRKTPSEFNGDKNIPSEDANITYTLNRIVTADSFEFVKDENGTEFADGEKLFIDAENKDSIFVKVNYSGGTLETSTIKLHSNNSKVLFDNGLDELLLSHIDSPVQSGMNNGTVGAYSIYEIPLLAVNAREKFELSVVVDYDYDNISSLLQGESVYLMKNQDIEIKAVSGNVKEFEDVLNGAFNFALALGDKVQFEVKDGNGLSQTIDSIDIKNIDEEIPEDFFNTNINIDKISNSVFEVSSYSTGKTQIINLLVNFFDVQDNNIVRASKEVCVQIAMYNPIGTISSSATKSTIGYINKYYDEITSSTITFKSASSILDTYPTNNVVFLKDGESVSVYGASQVQVKFSVEDYNKLKSLKDDGLIEIYYNNNGNKIQLLESYSQILTDNNINFLEGDIVVKLNGQADLLDKISFNLTALKFETVSSVSTNVSIAISKINKADRIEVDGDFIQTGTDSRELQMSFMHVGPGEDVNAEFNANIKFIKNATEDKNINELLSNIETALTYLLYKYEVDENGQLMTDSGGNAIYHSLDTAFFNVSFNKGKVLVSVNKSLGGGLFRLVLATKDSYQPSTNLIDGEDNFNTKFILNVRVSDGSKQARFIITSEEDLNNINNNLDSHYSLGANLGEDDWINIAPIGVIDIGGTKTVYPFTGSFIGSLQQIGDDGKEKVTSYSMKIQIQQTVESQAYGDLAGLFAYNQGNITNLNLIVNFSDITSDKEKGLKIGSVAAINEGTISGVDVTYFIETNIQAAGTVDFGVITGINEATIKKSTTYSDGLTLNLSAQQTHNIGLIAGTNKGDIEGSYEGKSSLNDFVYDVVAKLTVVNNNQSDSDNTIFNIGGVAGINEKKISNILIGGNILVTSKHGVEYQSGVLGGVAGKSSENVSTVAMLSLDLKADAQDIDVGGIIGSLSGTLSWAKFISANSSVGKGSVIGLSNVAGLVANLNGGNIEFSSVESFVDENNFWTIAGGAVTAGLVASGSGTVKYSFVHANINSQGTIYLTSNFIDNNTYFIGNVNKEEYTSNGTYCVTNFSLSSLSLSPYFEDVEVDADTVDWEGIYIKNDDGTYSKAESFIDAKVYKKFNSDTWGAYVSSLYGENSGWKVDSNHNIIQYNGVNLNYPYLVVGDEDTPIMIVKPQAISATVNKDYTIDRITQKYVANFGYADEDDDTNYDNLVAESIIVNYFKGASDEDNAHYLINKDDENGLFDVSIVPDDAQGGLAYQIVKGYNNAYINQKNQVVFVRATGNDPVIIRIYSIFNSKIEVYIAVYAESLQTELTLKSNSIYVENGARNINLYTGQNNKILAFNAENKKDGQSYANLFDSNSVSKHLKVEYKIYDVSEGPQISEDNELKLEDSQLELNVSNFNNITLKIKELNDDETLQYKKLSINFLLILNKDYFGPKYKGDDVEIDVVELFVNLHYSAKGIEVDGNDAEVATNGDISLHVDLTTEQVNKDLYQSADGKYNGIRFEDDDVDSDGNIIYTVKNLGGEEIDTDGIIISFNITSGNDQVSELKTKNNIAHFADLFNVQIVSRLYQTTDKILGYSYDILLEIKDEHNYRYIEKEIRFNIIITAVSNNDINNTKSPVQIILKPSEISTLRMENYVVRSLNFHTDYTSIVGNNNVETSIIEPGGLGNVMMIYLEPSYANVNEVTIKAGEVYIPSLNRNVQVKFTQIALDYRNNSDGMFTTLSANKGNVQEGDTLKLTKISQIGNDGEDIYTGILCVLIQIEEFAGLEASLDIEINAKTANNIEGITRHRYLLTTYLPGTEISYNEDRKISNVDYGDGYLIQKATFNNEVKVKIYGYQFNSNPVFNFTWASSTETENPKLLNKGNETYDIDDYVSYYLKQDMEDIEYNYADDSYTLTLLIKVSEDIPAPFKLKSQLFLTTKDGQLQVSEGNTLIFYPTDYIINSVSIKGLSNNNKLIAINQTKPLEFSFTTDNIYNDLSDTIYRSIVENIGVNGIGKLFTYYANGHITFNDEHSEFEYNLVNDSIISITGLEQFNNLVTVSINYSWTWDPDKGEYVMKFGTDGKNLQTSFIMQIYAIDDETEIPIYSAEDIYNSDTQTWELYEGANYILMNDIVLENVKPITTSIARFDGNNRVISIKSFLGNSETGKYGLFESIGTYEYKINDSEESFTRKTILKNMIVDYAEFEGSLATNNDTTKDIIFGGLVAENRGGLIYNCDVMNIGTDTKTINIIVASDANVTIGGLVGVNSGIITNSRVGRSSYTKITATQTIESTQTKYAEDLTFEVLNKDETNNTAEVGVNSFKVVIGGFVGSNSGSIASSYVENTNIKNHSTNEETNQTAGFVGSNSGSIAYSYVKADDNTITDQKPNATGNVVESVGNGIVAGFVYKNEGDINNAYANLELKTNSTYIAGFVYHNTEGASISQSYAATTMNVINPKHTYAEQPFVGVTSDGELLSYGTLNNTYYLMRSPSDDPYIDPADKTKDIAYALDKDNFQDSEHLINFSFVLSNSKSERSQGIWSYYTINNKKRVLPELMTATNIAHSYRYAVKVMVNGLEQNEFRNSASYASGTENNPYIISSVNDFNNVFKTSNTSERFVGYVRFIDDINFNNDETAIQTRANFVLGNNDSEKTSVEGNGLTVSGIYLEVDDAVVESIGMFAKIENSYIKNLNLKFATPETDGQFSTTTATYSGGLAGVIENSDIINIKLTGGSTTLTGKNFVGGVAGLITGKSLIYGIETDLNVKAGGTENYLYYNEEDYNNLNISSEDYEQYLTHLSYAGGIAGVIDIEKRDYANFNLQYIDVRGDRMKSKTFDNKEEANILAEYAGGIAGYAGIGTNSFRLRYFTGSSEIIQGDTSVGGLYGVCLGKITASQVTADNDTQFKIDTSIGEYITVLEEGKTASLNIEGNTSLLKGDNYVGGLVGIGLNSVIHASYSKASIVGGKTVGGLVGLMLAGGINYSYAVPYVNINENLLNVGGLIGEVYPVLLSTVPNDILIKKYDALLKYYNVNNGSTDIQFTYSTIVLDNNSTTTLPTNAKLDYIVAKGDLDYIITSGNSDLIYVYAGNVKKYKFEITNNLSTKRASNVELMRLFNVGTTDQVIAFKEIFSGWAVVKYWVINENKYFPLLDHKVVDNFIIINDAGDLNLLKIYPNAKFKVVNNITVPYKEGNWIVSGQFTGVLVGETNNPDIRPVITINKLIPNENGSTGFFEKTQNATISTLVFAWNSGAINLEQNKTISMVSGLTCNDINSLISNIEVRVSEEKDGEGNDITNILSDDSKAIGGFGGIVGISQNTNLSGCNFIGQLSAELVSVDDKEVYVGGAIASSTSVNDASIFSNIFVGASKRQSNEHNGVIYPKTKFKLKYSEETAAIYVGGLIGKANYVAISSSLVGNLNADEDYQKVDIDVSLNRSTGNCYFGGLFGYAESGQIETSNSSTNLTISGNMSGDNNTVYVGGLGGVYSNGDLTKVDASANIKTSGFETESMVLAGGVATISGATTIQQALFTGSIDTSDDQNIDISNNASSIQNLDAGGAVGQVVNDATLQEVMTDVVITGKNNGGHLYLGGLVGSCNSGKLQISYSSSVGRIIPIAEDNDVYVGGLIGYVKNSDVLINNSYTLSSIILDSIAKNELIKNIKVNALIGYINDNTKTIKVDNTIFSSDYNLTTDENNIDGNRIGTNIAGATIINSNEWHEELTGENDIIWYSNVNINIPYLSSLKVMLIKHGILILKEKEYVYKKGIAFNPINLNDGNNDLSEEYAYYLLTNAGYFNSGSFSGVIIGGNDEIEWNNQNAVVDKIGQHSAISNVHLKLKSNSQYSVTSFIAGENSGVIYNCSVQGTGITLIGGNGGIISSSNGGLISHCYSTIEVTNNNAQVAGITHSNEGNIVSCYFTGYIDLNSCGIAYSNSNGYLYNNYMSGVVSKKDETAFVVNNFVGSKNYIDKYSAIGYNNTIDGLESVLTASLMANASNLLDGHWATTVSQGEFKEGATTFGYNYNYPIYNFNKKYYNNISLDYIDLTKYQLATGTGKVNEISGTPNYYKVPHLGVLSSIQNLINDERHCLLIYDIDGKIDNQTNVVWDAIGSKNKVNGFKLKEGNNTFNGTFSSNKYYDWTENNESSCVITNLSNNGLFANIDGTNIDGANISNLKLGNFTDLESSGSLGEKVTNATLDNIQFIENSVITGAGVIGGLFGTIEGELNVDKFESGSDSSSNVTILGTVSSTAAGLISGTLKGTIKLIENNDSKYCVTFENLNISGGLVGQTITGQTTDNSSKIEGGNNLVVIAISNNNDSEDCVNTLGGIVGETTNNTIIQDISLNIATTELTANQFGGVVGIVGANTELNNVTISGSIVNFIRNPYESSYYGLVAGKQVANLTAESLIISGISNINIECKDGAAVYNDNQSSTGVGTFVGAVVGADDNKIETNIEYTSTGKISLTSNGVPNLGGYIGYATNVNSLTFVGKDNPISFKLTGTTNVGGFIGFFKGDNLIDIIKNDENDQLINRKYATIIVNGYSDLNENEESIHKNFGGLFGRLEGNINSVNELTNNNIIELGHYHIAQNVGGIAGLWIAPESNTNKLTNNGKITSGMFDDNYERASSVDNENPYVKAMNVGGIFGSVEFENEEISLQSLTNTAEIHGYQNVGGLIGRIDGGQIIGTNSVANSIAGIINVGGAVGLARNSTISNIQTTANVYGNANVGGLVGFCNNSELSNNTIQSANNTGTETDSNAVLDETETKLVVKGIYYNVDENKSFIPTSVGGLVGTVYKDSTLKGNKLNRIEITSSKEGDLVDESTSTYSQTISTISNYMAVINMGEGNDASTSLFCDNKIYNLDENDKLSFNNIRSGFGGFAGTINSDTANKRSASDILDIETNSISDFSIEAQLGINVGTFYGVYNYDHTKENEKIAIPTLDIASEDDSNTDIYVDGSYNVGGIIGFINGDNLPAFSNENLSNSVVNVHLTSRINAMYVGGLFGKTNANSTGKLSLDNSHNYKIKIYTDGDYFVGGLIGRAEISETNNNGINGRLGYWEEEEKQDSNGNTYTEWKCVRGDDVVVGDDKTNFGAFIGMLKLSKTLSPITANVKGLHNKAFTINTIENANYYDGESRFDANESGDFGNVTQLISEAYYVNRDSFNIDGSHDADLYKNGATNPLNSQAKGWSKQYTGFKQIQRCIPNHEHQADWDSTTVLYDAANITHVGTIENLGLWRDNDNNGINDFSFQYESDRRDDLPKDYICFTVYRQSDKQHNLYSRIGIASAMYDAGNSKFMTPSNESDTQNKSDTQNESGKPIEYLDLYYDTCLLKDYYYNQYAPGEEFDENIIYFNWKDGTNNWREYHVLGSTESEDSKSIKHDANTYKCLTYFVPKYLTGDAEYKFSSDTYNGAYFQFDLIYENATLNDLVGDNYSDDYLPSSGSVFSAYGMYGADVEAARHVGGDPTNYAIIAVVLGIVFTAVATGFLAYAIYGIVALSLAAETALAFIVPAIAFGFAAYDSYILASNIKNDWLNQVSANKLAYEKFIQAFEKDAKLNYGFMSSVYNRQIAYQNNKLQEISDHMIKNTEGEFYYYYSNSRPNDYHFNEWVGTKVTLTDSNGQKVNNFDNIDEQKTYKINYESDSLYESVSPSDHKLVKVNIGDEEREVYIAKTVDNELYMIARRYEFKNGGYYINANLGELEYVRKSLDYIPQDLIKDVHYIETSNGLYVKGKYENDTYSFESNNSNMVTYVNGKYIINGVTIEQNNVKGFIEETRTIKYKPVDSYSIEGKSEGYDYLSNKKAYYTAGGPASTYKKFAKFEYTSSPTGTQGVDYVITADGYNYQLCDESFEDSAHTNLEDKINVDRKEINKYISVPVYLSTFENPYSAYANLGETSYYSDYWEADNSNGIIPHNAKFFLYEGGYATVDVEVTDKDGENTETFKFVYTKMSQETIKKFTSIKLEKITNYDDVINGTADEFITDKSTITDSLDTFFKNWGKYGGSNGHYCIVGMNQAFDQVFQVRNPVRNEDGTYSSYDAYSISIEYGIDENGLLVKRIWVPKIPSQFTMFENMYLTNARYGFYTRYKYTQNGTISDFTTAWEFNDEQQYGIFPNSYKYVRDIELIESCRVILGGGYENVKLGSDSTANSGNININDYTKESEN